MTKKHCTKTSFATEKDAQNFIDKLVKTSIREKTPRSAYLCPDCNNWHVTSSIQYKELRVKLEAQAVEITELKSQLKEAKKTQPFKKKIAGLQNFIFLQKQAIDNRDEKIKYLKMVIQGLKKESK